MGPGEGNGTARGEGEKGVRSKERKVSNDPPARSAGRPARGCLGWRARREESGDDRRPAEVVELTRRVEARAMKGDRWENGMADAEDGTRGRTTSSSLGAASGAAKARGEVLIDNPPEQSKHQKIIIDDNGIAIFAMFTHILVSKTESVRIRWPRRHLLPNGGPEMT